MTGRPAGLLIRFLLASVRTQFREWEVAAARLPARVPNEAIGILLRASGPRRGSCRPRRRATEQSSASGSFDQRFFDPPSVRPVAVPRVRPLLDEAPASLSASRRAGSPYPEPLGDLSTLQSTIVYMSSRSAPGICDVVHALRNSGTEALFHLGLQPFFSHGVCSRRPSWCRPPTQGRDVMNLTGSKLWSL